MYIILPGYLGLYCIAWLPAILSEEDDHGVERGKQEDCQAGEVMVSWCYGPMVTRKSWYHGVTHGLEGGQEDSQTGEVMRKALGILSNFGSVYTLTLKLLFELV